MSWWACLLYTSYLLRRDLEDIQEFLDSVLKGEYDRAGQEEVLSHVKRIIVHMKAIKE